MKTSEEFIKEIYGKRDAIIKKRKKQTAFAATAVCAVLCVSVALTANVFSGDGINKFSLITEIEQGGFFNKNGNETQTGELNALNGDANEQELPPEPESTTCPELYFIIEDNAETAEVATEISFEEGVADVPFGYETQESEEGLSDGVNSNNGVLESTTAVVKAENDDETTTAAPPRPPKPTTEQIIEAAYNVFPEEEREYVIKETANSMIKKYNDGRHEYEVWFHTVQDKYVGVRLDAELNPIPANQIE